jgi:hypothetical protein
MDIGREAIGIIERADANEAQGISRSGVVAPQGDAAVRTARDFLPLSAIGRRIHHFGLALQQDYAIGFNQCIQREGRACFALTPTTMTAVDEHRFACHSVAHSTAGDEPSNRMVPTGEASGPSAGLGGIARALGTAPPKMLKIFIQRLPNEFVLKPYFACRWEFLGYVKRCSCYIDRVRAFAMLICQ